MEYFIEFWGEGKNLQWYQMCMRALMSFFLVLVFLRISGRRSFGMRTPQDNIVVILLGSMMSRAIVGATPFGSVMAASFILVLLHRIAAWFAVHSKTLSKIIDGEKICLYKDKIFLKKNMARALISEEDIMQEIRKAISTGDIEKVEMIYIERTGELSIIEKDTIEKTISTKPFQ